MPSDLLVAGVSGASALIGALLAPLVSRIGRKRDDVIALRTEWAKRLLIAYRQIGGPNASNTLEQPPVELELLEPRDTATLQQWMAERSILTGLRMNWIKNDDPKCQLSTTYQKDQARVSRDIVREQTDTRVILAEWASGSRKWPRWRVRLLIRANRRPIYVASHDWFAVLGVDPDHE